MFEQATQVAARYAEAKKRMEEDGQKAIGEMIQEFLGMFPHVHALTWYQYTPYFNDGDPCTFRLGDFSFRMTYADLAFYGLTIGEVNDDDREDDDGTMGPDGVSTFRVESYSLHSYQNRERSYKSVEAKNLEDTLDEFCKAANSLEEAFEAAYGDHQRITVSRTYTDVEEYFHE